MPDTKVFALGRERGEEGWLKYPLDKSLRARYYSSELLERIMTHPAKQNAWLHQDICEYVSEPGETILDPFGGVGTSLLSAVLGRNVILLEIEPYYAAIIEDSIKELHVREEAARASVVNDYEGNLPPSSLGSMLFINSDNRLAMPGIKCDHIITSPPYGNDLAKTAEDQALTKEVGKQGMQYTKATQNIGKLNPFIYEQVMLKVYKMMVDCVRPGGTITITHRDRTKDGERLLYIDSIVGTLLKLGMRVKLLEKWKAPGSLAARVNEKLGNEVVLDEDIICMEKPL